MRKLTDVERKRWYGYRKAGGSRLARCKVNALSWSTANSFKHEQAKFKKLYELVKDGHACITEAVDSKTLLRHDLIDLTDDVIYEFETDVRRAKRFIGMKKVEIVMVR